MEEFYIDVQLNRGSLRLQVDEIPSEQWLTPNTPQFLIEFHDGSSFITITLRMEQGKWYDKNTRLSEDEYHLRYFDLGEQAWDSNYQSPLFPEEIDEIGKAISKYMIVYLTDYMSMFLPSFPNPKVN